MDIKNDFSLAECRILIDILSHHGDAKLLTVSKLAKAIDVSVGNPKFYKVITYLSKNSIIIQTDVIGPSKVIRVNNKGLRNLIDEQDLVNYFYNYFHGYHFCSW